MATNIEITFSSLPAVDTVLSITDSYTGLTYLETFKASRTTIGECAIGSFVSETAQNYQNAFNNDYNASLLYTTQLIVFPIAKLIITAVNPNSQFSIASNTTSGAVTTSIDNVTPPTVFDFTEILVNPASVGTICDDVEFSVETNEQSDNILFPINQAVSTNPFVFEYPRIGNITIEMEKDGSTILQKYRIPKLLSSYIDIQIVNTPNNASVTAVRLSPLTDNETPSAIFPLTFQYAIFGLGSNFVTNGDFENGTTDWQNPSYVGNNSATLSIDNNALKVEKNANLDWRTSFVNQPIAAFTNGKTYKITYSLKDGNTSGADVYIRTSFDRSANTVNIKSLTNDWVEYTDYYVADSNANDISFGVLAWQNTGSGQYYFIDNVSVQEVDVELYPYQNSNSWSGIPVGEYSLGVKDNLGCEIFIPFTIDGFTPNLVDYDAVLEVSKVNSLQFKENEAWANCGIRKNITNTLSYEEDVKINNRSYKQLFQQCDTIRTQIKSNYTTNEAKLVNCNGVETTITITKATENLNITDVRDGTIFIKFGNQIAVQFLAGNTYDPVTLVQNGSYNLNGDLMEWINIGDYINIEGAGWCYITTILPPSQVSEAYTVVTTTLNNGLFTDLDVVKITSVYNAVDYDRYEFDIDMNALSGDYYVKLNMSDSAFGNKEYISEWFNVATEQQCHHLIDYYNTKNNEINYATGITFRLRIPYIKNLKWQPEIDENEIYVTDTRTVLLESRIREAYEITFMPLPTAMAQKLVLALSHDKLQIDGLNYIKNDEPEIEPYGTTNLYSVKCTIVRSDYVFDNTGGTTAGEVILGAGQTFEIDGNASGLLYIN